MRLVGPGYVWIDHAYGIEARTEADFQAIMQSDTEWSDWKWEITGTTECVDGSLVVQATISRRLTGTWRSIKGYG